MAEFFVLNLERFDSDPSKEPIPDSLLPLSFMERLLDQIRIELRFSQGGFTLLHFPKSCLQCTSRRQGLAQLVATHDADKEKTRESLSQQVQIARRRIAKSVCLSQTREKIVQVPAHQFETEDLVVCSFAVRDAAHVRSIIGGRVEPELCGIARFVFRQKKLFRHARAACVAQSIS